jgi:hypothetical protein
MDLPFLDEHSVTAAESRPPRSNGEPRWTFLPLARGLGNPVTPGATLPL